MHLHLNLNLNLYLHMYMMHLHMLHLHMMHMNLVQCTVFSFLYPVGVPCLQSKGRQWRRKTGWRGRMLPPGMNIR